jgi:hypothetical protein
LGSKIFSILPSAPELAIAAEIKHQPIITHQSESIIARQLTKLAKMLISARK